MNNGQEKKVMNGILADTFVSAVIYPLNTLRIKKQLGIVAKNNKRFLFKGFKYGIMNDFIYGLGFYTFNDGIDIMNKFNPVVKTMISSSIGLIMSHPINIRRKCRQLGKNQRLRTIKDNYRAIELSMLNTVPGTTINFTTKDLIRPLLPYDFQPYTGIFSSFLSIIATHPIDTISTATSTGLKQKKVFSAISERMIEKNISIGGKMIILDKLNDSIK